MVNTKCCSFCNHSRDGRSKLCNDYEPVTVDIHNGCVRKRRRNASMGFIRVLFQDQEPDLQEFFLNL